ILTALVGALLVPVFHLGTVTAITDDEKRAACVALGRDPAECTDTTTSGTEVSNLVATAVNIISWVVGVAAIIMILIGGFKSITANGDSNALTSAKHTILSALIGLVVAVMAQMLVRFVLNRV